MNIELDGFEDLGSLAEINNIHLHFDNYQLIQFDSPWKDEDKVPIEKEWYLMGVNPQKEKGIEQKFSSPELLISLVNLAAKIIDGYGLYDQKGNEDELAFCQDIIDWCKKCGLPYEEKYFMKRYYEINRIGGMRAFRLWEFKRRIAMLYDAFQLWYGLAFNEPERIIKFARGSCGLQEGKPLDMQIPLLKESLSYEIWSNMRTEIGLRYSKNTDSFEIVPYTSNLISVAYFQLAMLTTTKGKKGVRFCTECNRLFGIEHGSTKICDDCQAAYHARKSRESRRRKKDNQSKMTRKRQ